MEILITSVSPLQLIGGKTFGLIGVGLTQMTIWISPVVLLFVLSLSVTGASLASLPKVASFGLLLLTFIPTFILISAVMMLIATSVADERESQLFSSFFILPLSIPMFTFLQIIEYPNSPLAMGLSLFPITAPVTLGLRIAFTDVPPAQFLLSFLITSVCAIIAIWGASKTWRYGILRYGQGLRLREFMPAVKSRMKRGLKIK
jgi:ABC-2 type transport system permease protein